jgi:hypothetical protein
MSTNIARPFRDTTHSHALTRFNNPTDFSMPLPIPAVLYSCLSHVEKIEANNPLGNRLRLNGAGNGFAEIRRNNPPCLPF